MSIYSHKIGSSARSGNATTTSTGVNNSHPIPQHGSARTRSTLQTTAITHANTTQTHSTHSTITPRTINPSSTTSSTTATISHFPSSSPIKNHSDNNNEKTASIILGVVLLSIAVLLMLILFIGLWRRKRKSGDLYLSRGRISQKQRRRQGCNWSCCGVFHRTRSPGSPASLSASSARNSLLRWIPPPEMIFAKSAPMNEGHRYYGPDEITGQESMDTGALVRPVKAQHSARRPRIRGGGGTDYERLENNERGLGVVVEEEEGEGEGHVQELPRNFGPRSDSRYSKSSSRYSTLSDGRVNPAHSRPTYETTPSPVLPIRSARSSTDWEQLVATASRGPFGPSNTARVRDPYSSPLLPSVATNMYQPINHQQPPPKRYRWRNQQYLVPYNPEPLTARQGQAASQLSPVIVPRRPVLPSRNPARDQARRQARESASPTVHYPLWEEVRGFDFEEAGGQVEGREQRMQAERWRGGGSARSAAVRPTESWWTAPEYKYTPEYNYNVGYDHG